MVVLFTVYCISVTGLFVYGLNCYYLVSRYLRGRTVGLARARRIRAAHESRVRDEELPAVTVQLPLYNERYVAGRLIHAVSRFDYPRDKLEIQVLDDSTDDTVEIVAELVRHFRREGLDIVRLRRKRREGYKAGALRDGLRAAGGELVAIFDADFVPAPDFLRRTVPYFGDLDVGLVQARWGHTNRNTSLLTRLQAIAIDGHFGIEQPGRRWGGLFLNFNGTAGVWRREAIEGAGGWHADTLTEDLDLSYRAQLEGWRIEYLPDVVVPAEVPADMSAFKAQQHRWAKGSVQTLKKLVGRVLRARIPLRQKVEGAIHLSHYLVHPCMLAILLLSVPLAEYWEGHVSPVAVAIMSVLLTISAFGPTTLYLTAQATMHRKWKRRALLLPLLVVLGTGIAVSNTKAALAAALGIRSGFVRTPKRALTGTGRARGGGYRLPIGPVPFLEAALSLYAGFAIYVYVRAGELLIIPFLLLYALGFGAVSLTSFREAWARRREGAADPLEGVAAVRRAELAYAAVWGHEERKASPSGYVREGGRRAG
jgi:cellulose synthase/poly-beta-1,6-N-acetylglucosamine synthase-like glycosyltransferase